MVPPALGVEQRAELKAVVQGLPSQAGIDPSNWNWKAVRQFVRDRFGLTLSRSPPQADLNYLHRLGFVPKVGLRGKWVVKGEPALVDSTSPRRGVKAGYSSAVCLETDEVELMELEGNSNSAAATAFLRSASGGRARHTQPLTVIRDNSPAHRGDALRAYLTTPGLNLRLVNLPSYRPDFNAPIFDQSRHLGLGASGSNGQLVPGHQGCGPRKGGRLFRRSDPPTRRSQTPLPNRAASKIDWRHPSQPSPP